MGYLVRMPQMGMSMEQGTVVEWATDVGGEVTEGEPVVVVESEKAEADVEARETGVLRSVLVAAGDVVEPGTPIGIVAGPDEDISALEAEAGGGAEADDGAATGADTGAAGNSAGGGEAPAPASDADVRATPGAKQAAMDADVDLGSVEGTGPGGVVTEDDVTAAIEAGGGDGPAADDAAGDAADVRATPGAKQAAGETGVDLAGVEGTGPGGVVTEDDVRAAAEAGGATGDAAATAAPSGAAALEVAERRELSGIQRTISERLSESYRNAVHVTLNRSIDTAALDAHVTAAETLGMAHSYNDLLVKAVGDALVEHPAFNAHFEDGEHVLYESVNVGVAVDTGEGLLTPVVPDVDALTVGEVRAARTDLTERVMDGDFTMDDLQGGTFTISNLGMFGVDSFDPVINPPQVAILGVGRIREDGTMTLSLSFDHRVVNGADAATFLDTIAGNLTDEETLAGYVG